jgi:ParB family chromosome partitioning protein
MTKQKGLGKGLQDMGLTELLSNINKPAKSNLIGQLTQADVASLFPGKYQPRRQFNKESLEELAQSIKSQGIIQPLIVRLSGVSKYEIIAGERRWRAAQLAGLKQLPIVIKEIDNEAAMAMGLIENMQREDLNAIDLAQGIDRLINEFSLTHQSIADIIGKSRTNVTNILRLLQLDPDLQALVKDGSIEMGHARALLGLPVEIRYDTAQLIIKKGLSVRSAEDLINKLKDKSSQEEKVRQIQEVSQYEKSFEEKLQTKYGKGVTVNKNKVVFKFKSVSELEDLLLKLI